MGVFSSKQSKPKRGVTDADRAVLSLKTQRRKLSNERSRAPELASSKTQDLVQLEGLIVKGVAEARKSIQAQRKERALLYLRKNKLYDHNIKNIDDYLLNVEQILANIESAQRNNRLFAALKEGNSALQQLQKQVALADVEKLNEETADAKDYQDQLRELLGQSLSAQDDAEALQELEQIQAAQEEAEMEKLPKAPKTEPAAAKQPQEVPQSATEELPSVPAHDVRIPGKQTDKRKQREEQLLAA